MTKQRAIGSMRRGWKMNMPSGRVVRRWASSGERGKEKECVRRLDD
jgi:hypothetical protein